MELWDAGLTGDNRVAARRGSWGALSPTLLPNPRVCICGSCAPSPLYDTAFSHSIFYSLFAVALTVHAWTLSILLIHTVVKILLKKEKRKIHGFG